MKKNAGPRQRPDRRGAGSTGSQALIEQLVLRNAPTGDSQKAWLCLPCVVFPK